MILLTCSAISSFCSILWIHIEVLKTNCLTEGWFVVNSRTAITVPTCSDLEVEGTVHSRI